MADTDIACEIIEGRLAAEIVLRTPDVIAFLDHRPVFKGHVLVCPTRHVDTMLDLPAELVVPLFDACRRIAAAMTTALGAQGTFVAVNNVVSQSVPHLHVHVVPRSKWTACAASSGRAPATPRVSWPRTGRCCATPWRRRSVELVETRGSVGRARRDQGFDKLKQLSRR